MTPKEAREKTVKSILKACAELEPGLTATLTPLELHEKYGGPKPQVIARIGLRSLKGIAAGVAVKQEDLTVTSYAASSSGARRKAFVVERAPIPEICGTCDDFAQSARFRRTEYLLQGICQSGMACSRNGQRVNRQDTCHGAWRLVEESS
jgi:hypothetical protein